MTLSRKETFTVSNFLSFARLLLAIPLWFLLDDIESVNDKVIFVILAIIAIITDFLDGYFARRKNEITEVGKILDPIADKIVVGVVVVKLFITGRIAEYFFFIIIGRDILIFLGGILLSSKLGKVLPSNMLGKITVTVLALLLMLIVLNFERSNLFFQTLYYSTLILIVVSFVAYVIRAIEFVNKNN